MLALINLIIRRTRLASRTPLASPASSALPRPHRFDPGPVLCAAERAPGQAGPLDPRPPAPALGRAGQRPPARRLLQTKGPGPPAQRGPGTPGPWLPPAFLPLRPGRTRRPLPGGSAGARVPQSGAGRGGAVWGACASSPPVPESRQVSAVTSRSR